MIVGSDREADDLHEADQSSAMIRQKMAEAMRHKKQKNIADQTCERTEKQMNMQINGQSLTITVL